ncbi:Hypothetical predicted protein, partial [Marmota monax]
VQGPSPAGRRQKAAASPAANVQTAAACLGPCRTGSVNRSRRFGAANDPPSPPSGEQLPTPGSANSPTHPALRTAPPAQRTGPRLPGTANTPANTTANGIPPWQRADVTGGGDNFIETSATGV